MEIVQKLSELLVRHTGGPLATHAGEILAHLANEPPFRDCANSFLICNLVGITAPRPLPYSLWTGSPVSDTYQLNPDPPSDYVSWTGLVDRRFTGRHLPPADDAYMARLPEIGDVLALYDRQDFIRSTNTSSLLCFFAQWFTDSFLRTVAGDTRRNTSNHEIDLCQIYGLDAETTRLLREGEGGRLRTSREGLFPARLYPHGTAIDDRFAKLPYMADLGDGQTIQDVALATVDVSDRERQERKLHLYATGLERGNSTVLYTAISSIFIREHNRLCGVLAAANPTWDDERLFQTARNINIVLMLKLTVNEYINHLARLPFKLSLERGFAESKPWYRTNRIAIEFDLLYRWHSLIPESIEVDGQRYSAAEYRFNNELLEVHGAEALIAAASRQPAGRLGLGNNPAFMRQAEANAHKLARQHRLQSFTAYQRCFNRPQVRSFEELAGPTPLAERLKQLYGSVDDVEFLVGLFAQQHGDDAVLPPLLTAMVGVDAFSQILTNPLLASNVYDAAFDRTAQAEIDATTSFEEVVRRNCQEGREDRVYASFALR